MNRNMDYKQKYKELKLKLKSLIYENEIYQEQLKQSQNEYLQLTKDRDFLLDRLLAYENVSESDCSDCTDAESDHELTNDKPIKRTEMTLNSASKKKRQDNETAKKKTVSVASKGTKKIKSSNEKSNKSPTTSSKKNDGQSNLINDTSGNQIGHQITTKSSIISNDQSKSNDCLANEHSSDEKVIDLAGNFHFNQEKLIFNDTPKLMYNNDLNGELSDAGTIDLDTLTSSNLHLNTNLDNNSSLNVNLTTNIFEVQ